MFAVPWERWWTYWTLGWGWGGRGEKQKQKLAGLSGASRVKEEGEGGGPESIALFATNHQNAMLFCQLNIGIYHPSPDYNSCIFFLQIFKGYFLMQS